MPIPGPNRNLIVLHSRRRVKKEDDPEVNQRKLENALLKRRELREIEESIAIALSKGARVEPGVHTAQLIPERRRGEFFMKLIILVVLLTAMPAVCSSSRIIEDVNGDGKIDMQDFLEDPSVPTSSASRKGIRPHA